MKLIYITSKRYPSSKADPFYVRKMAEAFAKLLGDNFLFLVRGVVPEQLKNTNARSVYAPHRFRTVSYFMLLPFLIGTGGWNKRTVYFFSYDPNLLSILIFWRNVFRFKYKICSDWHQLFDDWRDGYVARHSDYLTSTSKKLRGSLVLRCGIDQKKILVAYGGVDTQPFREKLHLERDALRKNLELPCDAFLVGYVGAFFSLGQGKGIDTMIRSLSQVDARVHMVFVGGSGAHIKAYAALAKELGVEKRCIFKGWQPFERVVEYELAMDVLAIPYPDTHHFRDYGFPMKVWEYMSTGRPIVYSLLAIINEVLEGRGIPCTPGDPESFAHAISSVYRDPHAASRASKRNPAAVQAYTWEARAKSIIDFIQK